MYRLLPLILLFTACGRYSAVPADLEPSPNEVSAQLLEGVRDGRNVDDLVDRLATYDPAELAGALRSREEKLAFWVNVYNGMVQYLLTRDPARYDDRGAFFSTPSFTVAGRELSPNEMEHGIIRGGENRFGLGFIPQLFTDKFSRTFRVKGGDSRVHFALNCGASDCPPVGIYRPETYNEQIDARVRSYLADHARIENRDGQRVLITSPLFSWFRGDFRDHDGVDDFLVEYGVLSEDEKDMEREYEEYDWTLETGIWAE